MSAASDTWKAPTALAAPFSRWAAACIFFASPDETSCRQARAWRANTFRTSLQRLVAHRLLCQMNKVDRAAL
ncbi:hypothetical protein AJ87_20170 [Rhizobium yanglingense]|nr:hypothetical protein AJ87_20170 [Rhizobium yanglingense]